MSTAMDGLIGGVGTATQQASSDTAPSSFSLPRVRAERLTLADLPALVQMHGNAQMMATLGGVRSAAETVEYLQRNLEHWADHGFGIWILRDPSTNRVMGRAGLRNAHVAGGSEVELGYALLPEFWGRGVATDAARACVTIGLQWLGVRSVVALTLPDNLASQRVLSKAALICEREIVHEGRPHLLYRTE